MTRLRLNTEYRNKIANRMRVHIEAEDTQEKEKYFQARENMNPMFIIIFIHIISYNICCN